MTAANRIQPPDSSADDLAACWCCVRFGIDTPAASDPHLSPGVCRTCGTRSPAACERAHAKAAGR